MNVIKESNLLNKIWGEDYVLLDSVNELFELELAYLEYQILTKEELLNRSAFLKTVNKNLTNHYKLCKPFNGHIADDRSAQTQAYFEEGKFATGYATHGLFPYRGKFHPQLVKGLLNILSIKPGEIVLDPMCGSGTLNVEASLLGIDSIGIDVSPFCRFMSKVKYQSLSIPIDLLSSISSHVEKWFKFFSEGKLETKMKRIKDIEKLKVYELVLLAYLDAMGYAQRVVNAEHKELFEKVLKRYQNMVIQTVKNPIINATKLGNANIIKGDARLLPLDSSTIDCVLTSPPYSFAIDYAANDSVQLEYLGYDVNLLRSSMLGLAGKTKSEKLQRYFDDMGKVVFEIVRVLKSKKFAIIIIGSNTNQTGGIRLEQTIINHFKQAGAPLVRSILKPIKGMRNIMKEEFILIFQKN